VDQSVDREVIAEKRVHAGKCWRVLQAGAAVFTVGGRFTATWTTHGGQAGQIRDAAWAEQIRAAVGRAEDAVAREGKTAIGRATEYLSGGLG